MAARSALQRRFFPLCRDGAIARLGAMIGVADRNLSPYALPVGQQYVCERYDAALGRLRKFPGDSAVLTLQGRLLRIINRKTEALAVFDAALAARPASARTLAWRGELLVHMEGGEERGLADLAEAARLRPEDVRPRLWLAAARMTRSADPETFACLDAVLKIDRNSVCALLLRAVAWERTSRLGEALADAARAARLAPLCAGAQLLRGRLEARLGKRGAAEDSFAAAARLDPDAKNFYMLLIPGASVDAGPGSLRLLDRYIRVHPSAAWALALRGDHLRTPVHHDYEAGMADLERAARLAPNLPWIRACLARSRVQYERVEEGVEDLKKALALDPRCAWLHSWMGEAHRRAKRFGLAEKSYRRAIALNPHFAQVRLWLGRLYGDRKLWRRAAGEFTRAGELDGAYGFAYAKRADAFLRLGRHAEAAADCDRALNLPLTCSREWVLAVRSRSRLALGDYAGAFDDLAGAIRKNLRESWIALEPGTARAGGEDCGGQALTALDEAIAQNSRAAWAYAWKGAALAGLGRREESLRAFDRSLEIDPWSAWARGMRGRMLWEGGRIENAAADLDEALARDGGYPWLWSWRAELRLGMGRYQDARVDAERALALAPRQPHALFCRGEALRRLGWKREASRSLDGAIEADPQFALAYLSRGVLRGERNRSGQLEDFRLAARLAPDLFRERLGEKAAADFARLISARGENR